MILQAGVDTVAVVVIGEAVNAGYITTLVVMAALGLIFREAWQVRKVIKTRDFSFAYYWAQGQNQLTVVMDVCAVTALLIAHQEVFAIEGKITMIGDQYPMLSGFGIGLGAASLVRFAINKFGGKAGVKPDEILDPAQPEEVPPTNP